MARSKKRAETAAEVPRQALDAKLFRRELAKWFRDNARELPWRGVRDPYATWLSEIMLQQTRVATVLERYVEFLAKFPTIAALAAADEADVLALWSGLGYYRRARMLHRGAQFVVREFDGKLPRRSELLRRLPGVGEYTAAAIASIAFRESIAVVDGNVERVLLRVLGLAEDHTAKARTQLYRVAQELMPASPSRGAQGNPPGDHNQAMMELGAMVCLPRAPLCLHCPVVAMCRTRGEHVTAPRTKQQSRTVAYLLTLRKRGTATEVLLERRSAGASLMPGMLELPPLPLDATHGREPVIRLRHSITNTNYYVQVFAEHSSAVPPEGDEPDDELEVRVGEELDDDAVLVTAPPPPPGSLRAAVPAAESALFWVPVSALSLQPLTGLARKTLQRLNVMHVPRPQLG